MFILVTWLYDCLQVQCEYLVMKDYEMLEGNHDFNIVNYYSLVDALIISV